MIGLQIGQRYYRQVVGIPQGSVLSALLCCYYYGNLENGKLNEFRTNDTQNVSRGSIPFRSLIYLIRHSVAAQIGR